MFCIRTAGLCNLILLFSEVISHPSVIFLIVFNLLFPQPFPIHLNLLQHIFSSKYHYLSQSTGLKKDVSAFTAHTPTHLQEAELKVMSPAECEAEYRSKGKEDLLRQAYPNLLQGAGIVCAGYPGRGACKVSTSVSDCGDVLIDAWEKEGWKAEQ